MASENVEPILLTRQNDSGPEIKLSQQRFKTPATERAVSILPNNVEPPKIIAHKSESRIRHRNISSLEPQLQEVKESSFVDVAVGRSGEYISPLKPVVRQVET